ncbi:ATP-binding protein [Nocardiopsis dassonvillei]|uniref:ATP-binding protein n=1 Tax=Nocardiopsis dassonvillei TaxID=2014 RepID=UPI00366CF252
MLGEIEFDEWQCVAELIDNAFDDFNELQRTGAPWPRGFKVSVMLPGSARPSDAEVVITDTGRGMSYERLEQAVRAGWSSNDRFDKLGLFGMGFNVATARLGRRTRVLTTRPGDAEWIGVEIDLDRIGDDFEADDITMPKSDPNEHGTRIEISRLHRDRADWLRRNASNLRTTLGKVYSWILENKPFELWVQGDRVNPRRHCRWGEDRYVIHGSGASSERIPAYIEIDQKYEPADACTMCGNWQEPGKERCDQCGANELTARERRIHGWLGVQRYLDKREFGVDFLRNGRKILQWDRQLFDWKNPNDPLGFVDTEYPIELAHQGGRLIGEIHLDHVPVTYQKNAFEYSDRGWRAAVDFLRGDGPLQPEKAKKAGYPENTSPLGRLFKGYRRNAAGRRYLIPGDGTRPIHEETRRWAKLFHAGQPAYQSDEKWWEAVLNHEERNKKAKLEKSREGTPSRPDEDAVLEALGTPEPDPTDETSTTAKPLTPKTITPTNTSHRTPQKETTQDRLNRYTSDSIVIPELTGDFGLPRLGNLHVETRSVSKGGLIDENGHQTPVLLSQGPGGTATAFLDEDHQAFARLGVDPSDLLLMEIASVLKVRAESDLPLSQLVSDLRARCLPDSILDMDVIGSQARELLDEVRRMMISKIEEDPIRAFKLLSTDELNATEEAMVLSGKGPDTDGLGTDGGFLLFTPPLFAVRLLEEWPEAFMDGRVFSGQYQSVSSSSARRLSLARVAGYLNDVAALVTSRARPKPIQLQRTRLSIKLLSDELAEGR